MIEERKQEILNIINYELDCYDEFTYYQSFLTRLMNANGFNKKECEFVFQVIPQLIEKHENLTIFRGFLIRGPKCKDCHFSIINYDSLKIYCTQLNKLIIKNVQLEDISNATHRKCPKLKK